MIFLIIGIAFGALALFGLVTGIVFIVRQHDDTLAVLLIAVSIFGLAVAIAIAFIPAGEATTAKKLEEEREVIIAYLEYDVNEKSIAAAMEFNEKINKNNNYFFMFQIEDREYLRIDITKYIKSAAKDE